MEGDLKNENILDIINLCTQSTSTIISKMWSALRTNIHISRRAKGKKHFIEKKPQTPEEAAAAQIKDDNQRTNKKRTVLSMEDQNSH